MASNVILDSIKEGNTEALRKITGILKRLRIDSPEIRTEIVDLEKQLGASRDTPSDTGTIQFQEPEYVLCDYSFINSLQPSNSRLLPIFFLLTLSWR
jgi:hypothetical protein